MTEVLHSEPTGARPLRIRRLPAVDSIRSTNVRTLLSQVVFVVLLTRSFSDPLFGLTGTELGGGATIGFGALVNALVIGIALLFVFANPRALPAGVLMMWAPFLVAVFGATLYAPHFTTAARLALVILTYWAMFVLPFFMFRSADDWPRFVLLVFASSVVPSLYSLWELRIALFDGDFRLQGTFTHPNIFAFYLVLLLGLALYVRASSAVRWPSGIRNAISFYIPVLLVFLAFTQTRSAWAACALMFLVYAVMIERRFLVGILVLPIVLSSQTMVGSRLADLTSGVEIDDFKQLNDSNRLNSYAWREVLWSSAMGPIANRPIQGHGLESFKPSTLEFFPLVTPEEGWNAHNWYLQILFEMGVIGLLAYIWLMATLVYRCVKGIRRDRNGTIVILSTIVAYSLESYSDNMAYYLAFNWYFMFVMGAFYAWSVHQSVGREVVDQARVAVGGLTPAPRRERSGRNVRSAHPLARRR